VALGAQHSSPLQSAVCDCTVAEDCESISAGHALHPMQHRLAAATPRKWADAIVEQELGQGWLRLRLIEDDSTVAIWNHGELISSARTGEPVALHGSYHALAVGSQWFNVLVDETR